MAAVTSFSSTEKMKSSKVSHLCARITASAHSGRTLEPLRQAAKPRSSWRVSIWCPRLMAGLRGSSRCWETQSTLGHSGALHSEIERLKNWAVAEVGPWLRCRRHITNARNPRTLSLTLALLRGGGGLRGVAQTRKGKTFDRRRPAGPRGPGAQAMSYPSTRH